MSAIWCANYIAHAGKTKKGQNPTHPKGKRRIDQDLAIVLTDLFGIQFYAQDFLCTCCYEAATENFRRFSPIGSSTRMGTDEFRPERSAAATALSNISIITSISRSLSDNEYSLSDASDEEMSNLESQIDREKSSELLNKVFALVGQSPIKDIRSRAILREKVNDALTIIRQAAEQIYRGKEREELLLNDMTEMTMNDATELIHNFKSLIEVSDYSEQIKLLTLVPKTWGRLKITNFFSCSEHQARYSIYLRDAGQILSLPMDLRGNIAFDPIVEKAIFDFLHSDEISRVWYTRRIGY